MKVRRRVIYTSEFAKIMTKCLAVSGSNESTVYVIICPTGAKLVANHVIISKIKRLYKRMKMTNLNSLQPLSGAYPDKKRSKITILVDSLIKMNLKLLL